MPARHGGVAFPLISLVVLTCFLGGCDPGKIHQQRAPSELRVPLVRDIRTLDPSGGQSGDIVTHNVIRQVFEGLVEYDPHTLAVVPRVAQSWTVSEDDRKWTFQLNEGIRFMDDPCFPSGRGREAAAPDVKYSIQRGIASIAGKSTGVDLPEIVGLPEFLAGDADEIVGITVESEREVTIRLRQPDPGLLHFLARPLCFLVAREAVQVYGNSMRVHPVGTGPFRLVSWKASTGVLLVRNRRYWRTDSSGERLPYLDALRFVRAPHDLDAFRLYRRGMLDTYISYHLGLDGSPDPGQESRWGQANHHIVSWSNTIYFRFNYRSDHPVIRDRRLRKALSFALPRKFSQIHVKAKGLLPPGLPGYDPNSKGQYSDLETARLLLEEAGYPEGKGLPRLKLLWPEWARNPVLQDALSKLGVPAELEFQDTETIGKLVLEGKADIFRDGWVADFPDPENFLFLFYSGSSQNLGSYSHSEYDRLFEILRGEGIPEKRWEIARRMEEILIEDTAALFHRHEREIQFVSTFVENWKGNCTNPMNIRYFERVRISPEAS